jgi:asparagine synthase (glutamine-hydrolysing)
LCGFFAIYSASGGVKNLKNKIVTAGKTLTHRGPDDDGFYCDDYFGVHFQRLAIIDLSLSGHQPMMSNDGRFTIVFNGEIYNYKELRNKLISLGYHFKSDSDSEVLLASFETWGKECVSYLRGMFSIVIWDSILHKLYAFRDRLGIKPLYVYQSNDTFIFASEIKAIISYAPEAKKINEDSVFKYLAKGWVDDSEATFYSKITSVAPATSLIIDNGEVSRSSYWQACFESSTSYEVEDFRNAFIDTVSLHLQSDVPLAATLSGGMDSSSIVSIMAKETDEPEEIKSYSVIPPETVDESFWIDRIVKYTGVSHDYLQPDWTEVPDIFDEVLKIHDEPFQSSSCVYQYLLRREVAAQGIKVLLVGEGGDEVLGGYRRLFFPYLYALKQDGREEYFEKALDGAYEFLGIERELVLSQLESYSDMIANGGSGQENKSAYGILNDEFIEEHSVIVNEPAYPPISDESPNRFFAHLIEHLKRHDIPYVLRMEDRNSMAHSIEARVPFLDHYFLEKVFSFDYAEFMYSGVNKSMLRRAMKGLLPDEVINRRDKSPRPGSNVHFIYDVLLEKMREVLKSKLFINSPWWKKGCAEQFEKDRQSLDVQRAEVWFRVYSVTRWLSLLENEPCPE